MILFVFFSDSTHDLLMKKLVEVEMDGQAAAKQVAALRDSIRRLKEVIPHHYLASGRDHTGARHH